MLVLQKFTYTAQVQMKFNLLDYFQKKSYLTLEIIGKKLRSCSPNKSKHILICRSGLVTEIELYCLYILCCRLSECLIVITCMALVRLDDPSLFDVNSWQFGCLISRVVLTTKCHIVQLSLSPLGFS